MTLVRPGSSEPAVTDWREVSDQDFDDLMVSLVPADGRRLVLIDGRSGGGKSTVAAVVASRLGAGLVHTDDVSWHLHPTAWAAELIAGVLTPWRAGESVRFRPPGWVAKDRPGLISVPACRVLVVEGVGAARRELASSADLVIWVQSDAAQARRRGVARDVAEGRTPAEAETFWDEWAAVEDPFLEQEQPWRRADLIVNGTAASGHWEIALGTGEGPSHV